MSFLPKTKREKRILLFLFFLLVVIALEIFLGAKYSAFRENQFKCFRWDTTTLWKLKSSFDGKAWNQPIQTNAQGFRGTEEYKLQSTHDYRIITLGDSRTFGFGVDEEKTFSATLQKQLRRQEYDVEVINAGVHGFSAVQCRAYLQELIRYNPQGIVFSPVYNDRRYLVVREPDSVESFHTLAWARRITDILSWSNSFFAFLCEAGQRKLAQIQNHPPPLNQVKVRVPKDSFKQELLETARFCQSNGIDLLFMKIYGNPSAYGIVDDAIEFYDQGEPKKTISLIEESDEEMPQHAYSLGQYYLGLSYQIIGEKEKAKAAFANHTPVGSLLGEAVLRSQSHYFAIYDKIAKEFNIPLVDTHNAVMKNDLEQEGVNFDAFFMDECHYTTEAHAAMGKELANTFQRIINSR